MRLLFLVVFFSVSSIGHSSETESCLIQRKDVFLEDLNEIHGPQMLGASAGGMQRDGLSMVFDQGELASWPRQLPARPPTPVQQAFQGQRFEMERSLPTRPLTPVRQELQGNRFEMVETALDDAASARAATLLGEHVGPALDGSEWRTRRAKSTTRTTTMSEAVAELAIAQEQAEFGKMLSWVLLGIVALGLAVLYVSESTVADLDAIATKRYSELDLDASKSLVELEDEEGYICDKETLDTDVYGFAVASLVRDSARIAQGRGHLPVRWARLIVSQAMLFVNMLLQLYLLCSILHLCASKSVHDIRESYNAYEWKMYGENKAHLVNPDRQDHKRGLKMHFTPEAFQALDPDLQEAVCNIPFSQPFFLLVILFIWTLTCTKEIKAVFDTSASLIVNTPTDLSMANSLYQAEEHEFAANTLAHEHSRGGGASVLGKAQLMRCNYLVVGHLTAHVKGYVIGFILVPRFALTATLVYVGCRWLAATNDFGELVLNAVALEFVLHTKSLLYHALVPNRNKRELRHTLIHPPSNYELVTAYVLLGNFMWFFVAAAWCLFYIYYIQQVLPEYNWDVRGPCEDWLRHNLNASAAR